MNEYDMQLYRDVVSSIVEKSLLEINPKILFKMEKQLKKQNLSFNDSLENPEQVLKILQATCGNSYGEIIKSISTKMNNVGKNTKFDDFLHVLKETMKQC